MADGKLCINCGFQETTHEIDISDLPEEDQKEIMDCYLNKGGFDDGEPLKDE